jgi:hypothetical protein
LALAAASLLSKRAVMRYGMRFLTHGAAQSLSVLATGFFVLAYGEIR